MAGLDAGAVSEAIGRTREAVCRWPETARECGVGPRTVKVVAEGLDARSGRASTADRASDPVRSRLELCFAERLFRGTA